jgi:hypothetical protein
MVPFGNYDLWKVTAQMFWDRIFLKNTSHLTLKQIHESFILT